MDPQQQNTDDRNCSAGQSTSICRIASMFHIPRILSILQFADDGEPECIKRQYGECRQTLTQFHLFNGRTRALYLYYRCVYRGITNRKCMSAAKRVVTPLMCTHPCPNSTGVQSCVTRAIED